MSSKFYLLIAAILVLSFPLELSYSQENKVSLDSLKSGGIYSITLINGKQFKGEFINGDSSTLTFDVQGRIRRIKIVQVASVHIPEYLINDNPETSDNISESMGKEFLFIGLVNAGISVPTGAFNDSYKTGFSMNLSIYHLFDRLMGAGTEFQYNYFSAVINTYKESYSNFSIKINLLIGNLRPEDNFILYGLFGVGLRYSGYLTSFYGTGTGLSYKVLKKIRINGELQFNKLNQSDFKLNENEPGGICGYISFRVGIMYAY